KKAGSNDPVKVAHALEGMKMQTSLGEVEMRADNHQILQPLFVSTLARGVKYDSEDTGLAGRRTRRSRARRRHCPRRARWNGRSRSGFLPRPERVHKGACRSSRIEMARPRDG